MGYKHTPRAGSTADAQCPDGQGAGSWEEKRCSGPGQVWLRRAEALVSLWTVKAGTPTSPLSILAATAQVDEGHQHIPLRSISLAHFQEVIRRMCRLPQMQVKPEKLPFLKKKSKHVCIRKVSKEQRQTSPPSHSCLRPSRRKLRPTRPCSLLPCQPSSVLANPGSPCLSCL